MHATVQVSDPQDIERALGELRQASLMRAAAGMPPVRATVLNLVAYAGTRALAAEIAGWVEALAEQHPSRAILLGREPRPADQDWDVHVWAHCHPALPGYVVCLEAVEIMARDQAVERLPAVILSLLLRDLPVVLWWPGDVPMGSPLFERLLVNADRLLVDTASAADPEGLLRRLAALGHAEHCACPIGDFNWDRLTPWRELIARFFDPPECRPSLERIEQVRLEFAAPPERRDSAQALLLTGWLGTRLGWVPEPGDWHETADGEQVTLLRGRSPVGVELVPLASWMGQEGLRHLTLRAGHPDGVATFSIRRAPEVGQAEVTTALPGHELWQNTVPFPTPTMVDLLNEELRRSGYDRIYAEALRLAVFLSAQHLATAGPPPPA